MLKIANPLLCRCAISPRVIADSPVEIPDGCVPVHEIPSNDRILAMTKLFEAAGWTEETAEQIRPTSGLEAPSSASTPSGSGTDADLPTSQTEAIA
jgi:hypothetical protein